MSENAGLARPCTGHDQQRARLVLDCGALLVVQPLEQSSSVGGRV